MFEIREKLTKILEREKRYDLFKNCMKAIPIFVEMEIAGFKLNTFEH